MRRAIKLLLAAVAILAVLCSGAWVASVVSLPGAISTGDHPDPETWTTGTYTLAAGAKATFKERIIVSGDVVLMLEDGCILSADKGINVSGDRTVMNSLTIEGGSLGDGKLIAFSDDDAHAAIGGGTFEGGGKITITGGMVMATANVNGKHMIVSGAAIGGGGCATMSTSLVALIGLAATRRRKR